VGIGNGKYQVTGVLADRYASNAMRHIWSQEEKILLERKIWIHVLKIQQKLGFKVLDDAISSYERVRDNIDIQRIISREKILKHDVKARIEEFNELAGYESIHIGMTSRDVTESVELFQMRLSLDLIEFKSLTFLRKLGETVHKYIDTPLVSRTHNVPAQVTTLGKRFATWAEELIIAVESIQQIRDRLPFRGIKGAVGTQQDLMDVLGAKAVTLDHEIAQLLGFKKVAESNSQVYPRSYDYQIVAGLVQVSAASTNMTTNIRLMSGHGLVSERFQNEQVGSSAMPHKVNARSSERVNGLGVVLKGFATMISEVSGNQWGEGDVSCSVVRRVALPSAFYAIDAILDTSISIISNLVINEQEINSELVKNLPFLLSSKILMQSVSLGKRREESHKAIKENAIIALKEYQRTGENIFFELVAKDDRLGLSRDFLDDLLVNPVRHAGRAPQQCETILNQISKLTEGINKFNAYNPTEPI
jgi:adenylosuccinate lyase